eukprot:g45754.t1
MTTSIPDVLNALYARFEQNTIGAATPAPTAPDTPVPSVTASDVRSVLLGVNPRKARGLDGAPVFTNIFNLSLLQEEAISLALYSSLEHLDNKDTYVRLLLIDYSFNTIIPSRLISKLQDLGLGSAFCNWIFSFLTHRLQSVSI